jgi:Tfp pilus assembly protein PilO
MLASKRNIVAAVIVVALIAGWFLLVWAPRSSEASAAAQTLEEVEAESERITREMARAAGELTEGRRGGETIEQLEAALPTDPALAAFLRLHRTAALASGVTIESMSPSSEEGVEAGAGIVGHAIDISAHGSVETVRNYLAAINHLDRVVAVDKFSLEQGGDSSARLNLGLIIYSRR